VLSAPSEADISAITYQRTSDLALHFVITVEGVYSVQLTPEFQRYIDYMENFDQTNLNACRTPLLSTIKTIALERYSKYAGLNYGDGKHRYFSGKEKDMSSFFYGGLDNLNQEDIDVINTYLQDINSFKISNIIRNNISPRCHWLNPEKDFNMYVVTFTPWVKAVQNGVTVDVTTVARGKLRCPPDIATELDKFDNNVIN
jgi:hypothetical protein